MLKLFKPSFKPVLFRRYHRTGGNAVIEISFVSPCFREEMGDH